MSEDNLMQKKIRTTRTRLDISDDYLVGVAWEVARLLAKRDVRVSNVKRVFEVIEQIIDGTSLTAVYSSYQEEDCKIECPCTSHE